jgi:hypothetical protein
MERLVAFVERGGPQELGVSRIHVAVDSFFPLGSFYLKKLAGHGVPVAVVDAKTLCAEPATVVESVSRMGCDAFLLVSHVKQCPEPHPGDDPGPPVRGMLYRSICDRPRGASGERSQVPVPLL